LQEGDTNCVAEKVAAMRHDVQVIGHGELLEWLRAEREAERLSNADIQRLLKLPSSRVAEIFRGDRQIRLDEAKALVDHYRLEQPSGLNADILASILEAVLPLAPGGAASERFAPALAEAVAYGLELLSRNRAMPPSDDALGVAAHGAALRFRDLSLQ
jgi:hypothetical protein